MKRRNTKRNVQLTAAAALAAALIAGQAAGFQVQADGDTIQLSSMIPENVTITEPVPLYEISLPSSDYGTLSWANDSSVPSERVQSYEVVFRPYDSSALSKISGWDGESDAIYSSVTVVVSGISEDSWEEDGYEYEEDYGYGDSDDLEEQEYSEESGGEDYGEQEETETQEINEETGGFGEASSDNSEDDEFKQTEEAVPESEVTPAATDMPEDTEDAEPAEILYETETPETTDASETSDTPEVTETPEVSETPYVSETPEASAIPSVSVTPAADENNIFDGEEQKIEEDTRSDSAEEDLTEEEQKARAAENHTCAGITVSGINLPWYVQFRVSSGDSYQFSNESEANVFKSYEFELWDLKNNTEYEIPDGEYISVTVPVKAGYEYTIEHLLDSGATETIVPSVDGSTMVFSTHSFSPFGIAGSKSLTDSTIEDTVYVTATPAAETTTAAVTSGASSSVTQTVSSGDGEESTYSAETEETGSEEDSGSSVNAVYTGDNTPILPFVILGIAAAAIICVIVYLRKRK